MARPVKDETGKRYGRLTVLSRTDSDFDKQTRWLCRCDCGKEKAVYATHLRGGSTISCGCYQSESSSARNGTHRLTEDIAYRSWVQMRARCNDPNHPSYPKYGGRGIKVCAAWDDFTVFLSDVGPRPSKDYSIERNNNDGDYEPGNCRWATRKEQQRNRSVTVFVEYEGKRVPLSSLFPRSALKKSTIAMRVSRGWDAHGAITLPLGSKKPR